MLYHVSKTHGLTVLKPQVSTHKKPYVYAIENVVTWLLFGAPHDDFDFIINEQDGKTVITECYPNAFRLMFQNKACSIYEVGEDGFMRGMTSWTPELVSENEVAVIREIFVENVYARLLDEEEHGNLIVRRYEATPEYKSMVSEHIVDRLIRFNAVYTESQRLEAHYGRLIDALKSIMDGHLL